MNELLIGIDVGTSACKVSVFDKSGNVIATVNEPYQVYYPNKGWAEQNPDEWWNAIAKAIKTATTKPGVNVDNIVGVGIDGQSWSAIPIDEYGNCLANTPIWFDTRSRDICEEVKNELGFDTIFNVAGNDFLPSYTTPKLIWFKKERPQIYQAAHKFLQSNSFIVMKLTKKITHDISQGYGLHFFNMKKCEYDKDLAKAMGIDINKIPALYPSHQVVGYVTATAASLTGLKEGTPVVAGGLDAACGTLGAGVYLPGQTQEQGGSAGGMSICMDSAVAHPKLILGAHVVPNTWLLQGGSVGGGGTLKWFKENLSKDNESFDDLTKLAESVKPGSEGVIYLPYMAGERSPIWDPDAKGVFYGLGYEKTKGHLIRAVLEGVAFSLEHNLRTAKEAGAQVKELLAMGGASNSVLWTQIKADVTGKTFKVPTSDTATTLGAAILAGVGVGLYEDFASAVNQTIVITRTQEPNLNNKAIYDHVYEGYINLYENLKNMFKTY